MKRGLMLMLGILFALAVASAEPMTLADRAAAIERASQAPDGIRVVLGHLSRLLGLSADVLRAQRTEHSLNWGELLIAHRLSRGSSLTLDQIVNELRSGKTWEEIAESHQVDVPRLVDQVQQSQQIVEQHSEDRAPHVSGDQPKPSPGRAGGGMGRGRR